MRKFFGILLSVYASLLLMQCGSETSEQPVDDTSVGEGNVSSGQSLYSQQCQLCHGADGTLGASGAANLTSSSLTEKEVQEIVKNGKGRMTAFDGLLSEKEIKAVSAYAVSLQQK